MQARISVGELMSEKVVTVEVDVPIAKVAQTMRRKNVGCVVVCEKGRPVGVITEWDIMKKVVEKNQEPKRFLARDVMSAPLISVKKDTDAVEALRLMVKKKIRRLPVVEGDRLLGIVTLVDLFSVLQEDKKIATEIEKIVGRK
jgi:CBS domain-containing protein